jgi:hypothetical protein
VTAKTWINEHIPLDRPEYAKQPESLLTDLFWRSEGSSLSTDIKLPRDSSLVRLVPRQRPSGSKPKIVETIRIANSVEVDELLFGQRGAPVPTSALLESLIAPRARQDKSLACVPVHPDVIVLQTLQGLVNKLGPPNLAKIIETVGWLGGADQKGCVAYSLLQAMSSHGAATGENFTDFMDAILPLIARKTWHELVQLPGGGPDLPAAWPGVKPRLIDSTRSKSLLAAHHQNTPFRWFWSKWKTLCDPKNNWFDVLPARRFVDWATCLLRTGLSFAYIWEADFYVKLHGCLVEEFQERQGKATGSDAMNKLMLSLNQGAILATFESPAAPATQKHSWNALRALLAKGYVARRRFEEYPQSENLRMDLKGKSLGLLAEKWLKSISTTVLEKLSAPLVIERNTANNTQEFVRYLLRPRASDDDTRDQADFYYLALTNASRSFWFQPGPEWLVVVAGLLSKRPGGKCTLGMLLEDFRSLGIRVDRWILVDFLEDAGLSTDSPDADNALVIQAGF